MIVIADTGPLNYLIRIQAIEVLPVLYGRVLVPPAVVAELKNSGAPEAVRMWIARPPQWMEIRAPSQVPDSALEEADLDVGERDAILLAQEWNADEVIMDDMDGRREAGPRHLHSIGTLGVLRLAEHEGLVDLRDA